jgi:O-antigen/teichoic acid export membrane protein
MTIALLLASVGSLLMILCSGLIAHLFENPNLFKVLMICSLQLIGQILFSVFFSVAVFFHEVRKATIVTVTTNLLRLGTLFFVIHYFPSLQLIFWALNAVALIQALAMYSAVPASVKSGFSFDRHIFKRVTEISGPLMLSGVVDRSVVYVDGIIISAMLTTKDFAIYRAGAFEVPFISSLYGSVAFIVIPEVAKLINKGKFDEIANLKRKAITSTAFIVYPILVFLLFFCKPLLTFYISDKYLGSAAVFAIFSLALLVRVNDYQDILISSGNGKTIFRTTSIMFFVNLTLNLVLIRFMGPVGGALSYIIWLFLYAFVLSLKSASTIHKSVFDFFDLKKLGLILLVSILFSLGVLAVYSVWNNVFLLMFLGIIYAISVYFTLYKMEVIDKLMVNNFLTKFRIFR